MIGQRSAATVGPRSSERILRPRSDTAKGERVAASLAARDSAVKPTAEVTRWLEKRRDAHAFLVRRIPFRELDGWHFAPDTGNLAHRTGRFFTIAGLDVSVEGDRTKSWRQPVIRQPETGILGLLAKEIDGVLHFLMQAKMEPGNPGMLQLSPTVQATRSNYTRAHGGARVRYLDYFVSPEPGRDHVLADSLQSEHGSWFHRKSNRNMVVETRDDPAVDEDFCWLTLGQIGELLRLDDVVNMDARSVLACVLPDDGAQALHPDTDVVSWLTAERSRQLVLARPTPLREVAGWTVGEEAIERPDSRYFRVVAVAAEAPTREVTGWSQPLVEPFGEGIAAFLTRRFHGVRHFLAQARVEGGLAHGPEIAPTVQCTPGNYAHLPPAERPLFLDGVLACAGSPRIRYEAVHSEEGGRLLNAQSRCLVIEADEEQAPLEAPRGYRWVTYGQLVALARHGHYLNVQARTLLACIGTIPELQGDAP
ncbi:NDP-hexose 2,3-dehydratase family protein [Streptomyces sp. NPDC048751]|uniref:NDP-hexose 2,3-dehydratase family protein n=1 Tax=Streptomyces sp. NPDC048751 TaxID=3365591 RepID=UPI003712454B